MCSRIPALMLSLLVETPGPHPATLATKSIAAATPGLPCFRARIVPLASINCASAAHLYASYAPPMPPRRSYPSNCWHSGP